MANSNATVNQARAGAWECGTHGRIYSFNSRADERDICEQLTARQAQLAAMLAVMAGASNDLKEFDGLTDETKLNYLWTCETLAAECQQLAGALSDAACRRARDAKESAHA